MTYTVTKNEEYKSFEIHFDAKPDAKTREALKALKFRWHAVRGLWYGYADDENAIRAAIDGAPAAEAPDAPASAPKEKPIKSLWNRTRTEDLPAYGTENAIKEAIKADAKAKGWGYDKAAAAYFRAHLRERFPECKFSVTSGGAGWLDRCDIRIKATPYARELVKGDINALNGRDRWDHHENSPELAAVLDYCKKLHDAADADDGDEWADYGAHHDLYGYASISSDYEQTEQSEAIRADVEDFRAQLEAERERKEAEERARIAEYEKQREIERAEAEQRAKIEAQKAAALMERVEIVDLAEADQIAFTSLSGGSGKEASRKELDERIAAHPDRERTDAVISRKITLTHPDDMEFFESEFLRDWPFLAGKGGTATEDVRLDADGVDYYKLNAEQRETVKIYCVDCVAIYDADGLRYIVDPEGYSYARYVYIPTEQTEQQPADEYKAAARAQSETNEAFYIPAPISEQIEAAELEAGEKITILHVNDMMISVSDTRATFEKIEACKYAQYNDAGRIVFKLPRKRGFYQIYIKPSAEFVLYRGDLPEIPDALKYEPTSTPTMHRLRAAGMGYKEYLKDVIKFYAAQGHEPIIDTFQR